MIGSHNYFLIIFSFYLLLLQQKDMPWPNIEFLHTLLEKYIASKKRRDQFSSFSSSNNNNNNSPSNNGSPNIGIHHHQYHHLTSNSTIPNNINNNNNQASKKLSFEMDRDKDRDNLIDMCESAFPFILAEDIPELYQRVDGICRDEDKFTEYWRSFNSNNNSNSTTTEEGESDNDGEDEDESDNPNGNTTTPINNNSTTVESTLQKKQQTKSSPRYNKNNYRTQRSPPAYGLVHITKLTGYFMDNLQLRTIISHTTDVLQALTMQYYQYKNNPIAATGNSTNTSNILIGMKEKYCVLRLLAIIGESTKYVTGSVKSMDGGIPWKNIEKVFHMILSFRHYPLFACCNIFSFSSLRYGIC